ncbi:MAG: hypothetical protein GQ569_04265 [Methylococcaceae bacterium]|nr:hypothetical protein [Methylococcaceae bacterium]
MKKSIFSFILMLFISLSLQADESTNAVTEDGRNVILYSDGTWAFRQEMPQLRPQKANKSLKGKRGAYEVFYNDKLWKQGNAGNEDAEIQLQHNNGDGYAMIIFERIPVPLENLKKLALENVRSVASNVEIAGEERKLVNGYEMMVLRINGAIEGIPFSYLNYYASGDWGTIQFVTYTATVLMPEYETDFLDLLNGLTIKQ